MYFVHVHVVNIQIVQAKLKLMYVQNNFNF